MSSLYSTKEKRSLLGLSYRKEDSLNSSKTLTYGLSVGLGSIPNLKKTVDPNEGEITGSSSEEPTDFYQGGMDSSEWPFTFPKVQFAQLMYITAFGLGAHGYDDLSDGAHRHTNTPTTADELPSFTLGWRYGGDTAPARQLSGNLISDFELSVKKGDKYATLSGSAIGTGKFDTSVAKVIVSSAASALTFAVSHVIMGASTASVHKVLLDLDGDSQYEVDATSYVSAVSTADPGVITISSAMSVSTALKNWKIIYQKAYTEEAWYGALTALSVVQEPPLRLVDASITNSVTITAVGDSSGGFQESCSLDGFTWSFSNNLKEPAKCIGSSGGGAYADEIRRGDRTQKITIARKAVDWLYQHQMEDTSATPPEFSLRLTFTHPTTIGTSAYPYKATIVFPRCVVTESPVGSDDGNYAETVTITVGEHATLGSVFVVVDNGISQEFLAA